MPKRNCCPRWPPGRGAFHVARDPAQIPAVLTQEAELAKNFVTVSSPMQPRLAAPSELFALTTTGAALPWLQGYVRTQSRPQAKTVLSSNDGEPILASWYYGRGPVIAWTSDLSGVWSAEWTAWDQFPAFVAALVNHLAGAHSPALHWQVDSRAGGAELELFFTDPEAVPTEGELGLTLVGDRGTRSAALVAVAPGVFRGRIAAEPGAWGFAINSAGRELATGRLAIPYPSELRPDPGAPARLERIAALTGGPGSRAGARPPGGGPRLAGGDNNPAARRYAGTAPAGRPARGRPATGASIAA